MTRTGLSTSSDRARGAELSLRASFCHAVMGRLSGDICHLSTPLTAPRILNFSPDASLAHFHALPLGFSYLPTLLTVNFLSLRRERYHRVSPSWSCSSRQEYPLYPAFGTVLPVRPSPAFYFSAFP